MTRTRDPIRIMLVVDTGEGAGERLAAALQAAPVACVMLRRPPHRTGNGVAEIAPLVSLAQRIGAAVLIADDPELARACGADGVHLGAGTDLADRQSAARARLGRDAIVGVDAGQLRHDAMTAGEDGADYIAFGLRPEPGAQAGSAEEERSELVHWWAEVFEVPCVALDIDTPEEAAALTEEGADFIAIPVRAAEPPSDTAERVRGIAAAVARVANLA